MLLLLATFQGCKSRKPSPDRYKYLIKETPTDSSHTVVAPPKPKPLPAGLVGTALSEADRYLGTPYRHGGINENGIDCSGLAHKAYLAAGINLPRSTVDQAIVGEPVDRKDLIPGDLVFFSAKSTGKIDHVGIIHSVEGEKVTFVHASTSKGVRHDRLDEGYWRDLFMSARRVSGLK